MAGWLRKITTGAFICLFGLFAAAGEIGAGSDYPHSEVTGTSCSSCHYNIATNVVPSWFDITTPYDGLCEACHNSSYLTDFTVDTHSNSTNSNYGVWSIDCRTCHWPHKQMQYRSYGSDSFVYNGTSTALNLTSNGTILTMTGAGWAEDQYNDYILIPNIQKEDYNFRITDTTSDTLLVDGEIDSARADVGDNFAIIYGKLIRSRINTPNSGLKTVRFFDRTGTNSYADGGSTYDGVCEVCHTQTTHFRNDGSGSDQLHSNVGGAAGKDCRTCHSHQDGFKHGGSSGGAANCVECHGHDAGSEYDPDMGLPFDPATGTSSMGAGTSWSHSTHTETDGDDLVGPAIYCDTCHDINSFPFFKSGTDSNGDGFYNLDETDVCDNCHSPGGTYNGTNDAEVGAKVNWDTGIYELDANGSRILRSGKDKWCATCHDEVQSNSKFDGSGISAPNIVGDEDNDTNYVYGVGWGYYKSGHGLAANETYPASGGSTAGAGAVCSDCHDLSSAHIDDIERTFDCGNFDCRDSYQTGYRLKDVNGTYPMNVKKADESYLCFSCHTNPDQFLTDAREGTNFYGTREGNVHDYHINDLYNKEVDHDWDGNYDDGWLSCIYCHNVHGSTNPAMIRDGSLTGRNGMISRYGNDCDTTDENSDITLVESTKLGTRNTSIYGYCAYACHGGSDGSFFEISRDPVNVLNLPPELNWADDPVYLTDGVNPNVAETGSTFYFKVKYSDINQDTPASVQLWIDRDDDGMYEDGVNPPEKIEMDLAYGDLNTCAKYSKGADYVTNVNLDKVSMSGDTINYTFRATADNGDNATGPATADSTLTILNKAPELAWTGETGYEADGVAPDYGPEDGNYTFRVKYLDDDNDTCPVSDSDEIQVWIDLDLNGDFDSGERFNLIEDSGSDTDCTVAGGGKMYYVDKVLPNPLSNDIIYDYRFFATDGTDNATGEPVTTGRTVTVADSGNNPPTLAWDTGTCRPEGAMPPRGELGSTINFSVLYFDEDNECPVNGTSDIQVYVDLNNSGTYTLDERIDLNEADIYDTNCTSAGGGKLYTIDVTTTDVGDGFPYEFHATDGMDEALGDPRTEGGTFDVISPDWVVKQDGTADFTSIDDAVDSSTSGDTILVYDGNYTESVGRSDYYNMQLFSACGPEDTVISSSSSPVVNIYRGGTSSVLDGFTITGSNSGYGFYAEGTKSDASDCQPTINNCIIRDNGGRGVSGVMTSITITGSEIYNNNGGGVAKAGNISDTIIRDNYSSSNGGGILGVPTLTNVVIAGNNATGSGGGVYSYGNQNSVSWEKVTLSGNKAGTGGGAYFTYCTPTITNSLISDNNATGNGGGIGIGAYCSVVLESSTVVNNTAGSDGGAFYSSDGPVDLYNSIAWGNRAGSSGHIGAFTRSGGSVVYNDLYGSIIENNGDLDITDDNYFYTPTVYIYTVDHGDNYDTDPNFVDPGNNGDYHLTVPSDAINNANDYTNHPVPSDDLDGNSRPAGLEDIGAYEIPDELMTVTFQTSFQSVSENGTAIVTLELSEVSQKSVEVPFTIHTDSTATDGADYSMGTASPVIIPAGDLTAEIAVNIATDSLDENDETVVLEMGTTVNATRGAKTIHTVNIADDDDLPTVTFTTPAQQTADENGTATVTLELSEISGRDVEVPFSVNGNSTATGGGTDYDITASPVTIAEGDLTTDITVTVAIDAIDENDETVVIDMDSTPYAYLGANTSHTLTITDDDTPPTVSFTSGAQSIDENGTAVITAQLSAVSGLDVTIPFTVNGTSTANATDYNITASPLTIFAGNNTADITITAIDDEDDEEDEILIVDMGSPGNATLGTTTSHTLTILDDDFDGNTPPETPVNLTPADNATDVDRTPIFTASAFSDPVDANDTHAASQWQISTDSDFNTVIYDNTDLSGNLESHEVSVTLDGASTYYWHVRYQDSGGAWSRYSDGTSFITTNVAMPEDALSYWKFDEGNGSIAYDSVGNNDGTLSGATWTVSGKYDDAVSFDGSSDMVDTGASSTSSLALTGDMTIEAWISASDLSGRVLISKGYSDEFELAFWSNQLHYYSDRPSSPYYWEVTFNTVFATDGTWYHVVLVRDGSERTVKLYVNGVQDSVTGQYYSDPPASSNRVYIGSRIDGSRSFSGIIDEVAIYDRMLTEDEIGLRYDAQGSGVTFSAPDQPVNLDPVDGESNVSVSPTLVCDTYHDDDNHTHAASRWEIRKASGSYGDADSYSTGRTVTDLTSFSLDGTVWPAVMSSWSYRTPLVLNQTTGTTNQRVKVVLSPADFEYANVESTGYDLRFYLADGTALSYSRPIWDYNGTSVLFVEVPATGVERIYMYYGNSGAGDVSDASITPNTLVDSGFEEFTSLADGYWEVKQTNSSSPFVINLETTDGNPDHYVYIDNDGSGLYGMNYFAQHITVPEDVITTASFSADYQTYCGRGDRSGMFEVLLLEETIWDNVVDGDSGFDYRTLYDGTGDEALWHEFIKTNGGDVGIWTYGETTSDLASVLNSHHGENLVAVIVWTAWHGDQVEWGKLDNFEMNYDFSAEPLTAALGVQQAYPVSSLAYGTEYYWHVQHEDQTGDLSLWSEETSFTTLLPSVAFDSASQSQLETGGNVTITLNLGGVVGQDVTVEFSVNASSTATGGGTDYTITSSPIVIPAGSNSADITVGLVDDSEQEVNNETVIVDLISATNANLGTTTSHTLSIIDDEYSGVAPDKPTNLIPANSATDVDRIPTLTASAFNDGDSDPHAASQWQLSLVSDFSTTIHDSGAVDANESHTVSATLDGDATYYWRVRYQDIRGLWSPYSDGTYFTTESSYPSTSGGMAYWNFNEGTGTDAADSFGGNNGTLDNTTWARGISYDAASFNAAGDKIMPVAGEGTGLLNGHSAHTVEAWINWSNTNSDLELIFNEGGGTHGYGMSLRNDSNKDIIYTVNSNSNVYNLTVSISYITPGEWTHMAATYDGGVGEMKLYINGVEVAQRTDAPASIPDAAYGWRIGGTLNEGDVHEQNASTSDSFTGEIDEMVIYNRALTQAEIQARVDAHYGNGPDRPVNNTPASGAVGVSLTPTLSCDPFQDDDNDNHAFSRWQVRKATGIYGDANSTDSGWNAAGLTSYTLGESLQGGTEYFWRVQHEDDTGDRSLWSEETGFTTN